MSKQWKTLRAVVELKVLGKYSENDFVRDLSQCIPRAKFGIVPNGKLMVKSYTRVRHTDNIPPRLADFLKLSRAFDIYKETIK